MRLSLAACLAFLAVATLAQDEPKQGTDPELQPETDEGLQYSVTDPIAIWNFCVEKQQDAPDGEFCNKASAKQKTALEKAKAAASKKLSPDKAALAVETADKERFDVMFNKKKKTGPVTLLGIQEQIDQANIMQPFRQPRSEMSLVELEAALEASGMGVTNTWPGATVPYVADSTLDAAAVVITDTALEKIMENTCIAFVEKKSQTKFLTIKPAPSSATTSSANGFGTKASEINMHSTQLDMNTILHEFGHALGLMHEHQRTDAHTNPKIQWAINDPADPSVGNPPPLKWCGWEGDSKNPTKITSLAWAYQHLSKGALAAYANKTPPPPGLSFSASDLDTWLPGATSKGTYNKNSIMHYRWNPCMQTTMTDKGNPGAAGWTAGDDETINDLYSCIKTEVTLNGVAKTVYTNKDQVFSAFKHKVFKKFPHVAPRHIKLKLGGKLMVGNNKKMSALGVKANSKMQFAFETLKLTYSGKTYHIPFKARTTLFFALQSVIEDITKVPVAKQEIKKGTEVLGADSQAKVKSMTQLSINKDTTLTMTKKP